MSWLLRHRQRPWDALWAARVRVILRPYGLPCGRLVIDDRDHQRSKAANTLAYRDTLRDKERGGDVWGQRLVLRLGGTPDRPLPGGFSVYQPAPALSAWYTQAQALTKQHVPPPQRPPKPPPKPY